MQHYLFGIMNIDVLNEKKLEICEMAAKHGARNVRVFGSVARGEQNESSDVDFLVSFEPGRTLFDHAALLYELESFLQCKVDVVSDQGLKPRFRYKVFREAICL